MSKFTAPLVVSPLGNGKTWIILHSSTSDTPGRITPFSYDLGHEGSGITITPPALFETDFTSVPRFLWWLFPRWGKYGPAAVIHDYLYSGHGFIEDIDAPSYHPDRKDADQIMLEAMVVLGVPRWQRRMIYWGVRIGGYWSWSSVR